MAEEQVTEAVEPSEEQGQETVSAEGNFRKSKLFMEMTAQINESRKALEEIKSQQEQKEAERQRKILEDKGNYEEALKASESKFVDQLAARDEQIRQMQKEVRDSKIKNLMVGAGVDNHLAVLGAIQMFEQNESESVSDWFAEFQNSDMFKGLVAEDGGPKHPRPASAVMGAASSKSLADRLASNDPAVRRAAAKEAAMLPQDKRAQTNAEAATLAAKRAKEKYRKR